MRTVIVPLLLDWDSSCPNSVVFEADSMHTGKDRIEPGGGRVLTVKKEKCADKEG